MNLKLAIIATAAVLIIVGLALPSMPALSAVGDKGLLQDTNRAIVGTTRVVGVLLLVLVFWLGPALYSFLKTLVPPKSRIGK